MSRAIAIAVLLMCGTAFSAGSGPASLDAVAPAKLPAMHWSDDSRERHFSKDPSVIRFKGHYYLYCSLPSFGDKRPGDGWRIGIEQSDDLLHWKHVGQLDPTMDFEKPGIGAPGARVLDGKVHLFYQSIGRGKEDAICHAWSDDGVHFLHDPTNPVFRPTGDWTVGRAIDAEVYVIGERLFLYFATRDPKMKIQMLGVAAADVKSDFSRGTFKQLVDHPILKPTLPWEGECIEAPTVCRHGDTYYMFYAGSYNNSPQQIGVATSKDGIEWSRLSDQPFIANGKPGEWNSSESGHPGVFVDDDGQTYLFYQGNDDMGRTWYLSHVKIGWKDDGPHIIGD